MRLLRGKPPHNDFVIFVSVLLALLAGISIFIGLKIISSITITLIIYYGFICVFIPVFDLLVIKRYNIKKSLDFLGLKNFKRSLLPGMIIGIVLLFSILVFFFVFHKFIIDGGKINILLGNWGLDKKYMIEFLFFMIVMNSIVEEIWWRGYIFQRFLNSMSKISAVLITSVFFSIHHFITTTNIFSLTYGFLFTFLIFLSGIFWAFIRIKFRSLYPNIISHMLSDLAIMVVYLKFVN